MWHEFKMEEEDVVKKKPSGEGILKACEKLGIKPNEAVFIGHKEYEMCGAKLAGVKSISIKKGVGEDHYIKDISEILDLIKKL